MRLESATRTLITSEAAAAGGHIRQVSEKLNRSGCGDCREAGDGPQGNWSQNLSTAFKTGIEITVWQELGVRTGSLWKAGELVRQRVPSTESCRRKPRSRERRGIENISRVAVDANHEREGHGFSRPASATRELQLSPLRAGTLPHQENCSSPAKSLQDLRPRTCDMANKQVHFCGYASGRHARGTLDQYAQNESSARR